MNGPHEQLPPEDEADLAALADGCLYGARRAELEARVAAEPALAAALERQLAALAMISASTVPAPPALRMRVEAIEAERAGRRPPWQWRPARRWLPATGLALAATLAALVVLAGTPGPAVDDVLAVALRPATAQASIGGGEWLAEQVDGVRFPRYAKWRATGTRVDVVEGRQVRTVFYERQGTVIAYAVVAGPALESSEELRRITEPGDRVAVTWTRRGRTCVIVGRGVDAAVLAKLAVW
jgi:anti-sigma factor RsiW